MASESSEIVIVCAPDGVEWGAFIQRKLSEPVYNIRTRTEDFRQVKIQALSDYKVQVVLLSPQLLDGVVESNIWDFSQFDKSSTVMILLGLTIQDIRDHLGSNSDRVFQCHHVTIHPEDPCHSLASALVEIIKVYERDESFDEDPFEDNIYMYPPSPRQINQIYRVIPPPERTSQSDTLILLDRPAEGDVIVDFNTDPGVKVKAEYLNKAVYSVKNPEEADWSLGMKVTCKDQVIGEDHGQLQSKLHQLRSLLQGLTNPLSLMCQALGLDSDSSELLDTALSEQIRNQWSSQTMQIFQMLEPNLAEEKSNHLWPTLPHFIAEFNLKKTCQELLKFPSTLMVMSCCLMNCEGEYPFEIAERKGYNDLVKLLTKVVEEHHDSGVVTDLPPPAPHLKAMDYVNQGHKGHQEEYQGILDTDATYMDMSGLSKVSPKKSETCPRPCKRTVNPKAGAVMQRSKSEASADSRISFMNPEYTTTDASVPPRVCSLGSTEEQLDPPLPPMSPPPTLPKKRPVTPPKPQVPKVDSTLPKPQVLPRSLLRLSDPPSAESSPRNSAGHSGSESDRVVPQEDVKPTETPVDQTEDGDTLETKLVGQLFDNIRRGRSESEPSPASNRLSDGSFSEGLEAQDKATSLIGDAFQQPSLRVAKTTRGRISSFLKKLGMRRHPSDSEQHRQDKQKKKAVIYARHSRGSDPGFAGMSFTKYQNTAGGRSATTQRKMSLPAVLEPPEPRDSGSFSEEEEGSKDSERISYRKRSNKFSGSGKKTSLERKKSVRVSRAMNEQISEAPSMPQSNRTHFPSSSTKT